MEQAEATEPRRRGGGAWLTLTAAFTALALALGGLVAVTLGPLQSASAAGSVVPSPSAAPSPIAPAPAVSASPTLSPGGDALYAAPPVGIVPLPPPPPKASGRRAVVTESGVQGYLAQGLLTLTNQERVANGLGELTWSPSLGSTARNWSITMADAGTMYHNPNRPPGGENVAWNWASWGYTRSESISVAHAGWMNSAPHRANILNPAWTTMGAGMAQNLDGEWYLTENFQ